MTILARATALVASACAAMSAQEAPPSVLRIELRNEAITPVTARFIAGAVEQARESGASAVVLVLDTPGGLLDSTREIVKTILQSPAPFVVYVAPPGARAASAGVFITMAAHVAAMAPGTHIGAAHPVSVGGIPGLPQEPEPAPKNAPKQDEDSTPGAAPANPPATPMEQKVLNDTVAWARSLAELRGRNADWIARAVTESVSVSAAEAVRERVVDLLAPDLDGLLAQIDGREISLLSGPVRLRTAGAVVLERRMWWGERLLAALANPTLAVLLLIFGVYGVIFELYSPGWGVAGTLGVVCLIVGFFSLAILPINFVGLALLVIALGMLVAEVFVASYGLLTLGGLLCLVMGAVMLVDSPAGFLRVSLWALAPAAAAIAAITVFLMTRVWRSQHLPVTVGSLTGDLSARASGDFSRDAQAFRGLVQVHGELWRAVSPEPVSDQEPVRVLRRDGLTLHVTPARRVDSEPA